MIRRLGPVSVVAGIVAGMALAGLATGTAVAAPSCGDYHWIGAAGSGQRDASSVSANGGMGSVIYQSYQQLQADLAASGRTITAEAVQYPAAAVPLEGGIGGWMDFLDSVKEGTAATAEQFEAFTERCPDTKVILAVYSLGALVVHRNLSALPPAPHGAGALLFAAGPRLPTDTTLAMGSAAVVPGVGKGVAQEHSFLASTNTSTLPPEIGGRTISVCDIGDPVCDYDPDSDSDEVSPAAIAIHTAYAPAVSGAHAWGSPLYQLVMASVPTTTPVTTSTVDLAAHGA